MKLTVVLDNKGTLVAAQHGTGERGQEAGLVAGPGQKLHQVDVPDEVVMAEDPHHFADRIKGHLPKG